MTGLGREASDLNRELTHLIMEAGRRLDFEVQAEYPVPGGRLDVVWSLRPASPIPHLDGAIPVVGFEIESSWRSRKHVKGDLLNLQDCGVALGVIVLAGSTPEDESLRRFTEVLVDRPGTRFLVWTEADVRALALGEIVRTLPVGLSREQVELDESPHGNGVREHHGKYRPLWAWLRGQEPRPLTVSFADLERAIGMSLPESCRTHLPHWYGYKGSAVARSIVDAGWRARKVQLNAGTVTFVPVTHTLI